MWSVVEKTALAEAEIEYHDHTSTTVWVKFPVAHASRPALEGRVGGDLDDDALDPARQPRHRLWRGHRLRAGRGHARPRGRTGEAGERIARVAEALAGDGTGTRRSAASSMRRSSGAISPAPSAAIRCTARATISMCRCSPAISSPMKTAPASSTSRRVMATTISCSAASTTSRCRDTVAADGSYPRQGAAVRRQARVPPQRQGGRRQRAR